MVRRLTLLLLSTVLFIPGGAFALGLGEIHLKSALNQAFDANIDLLSVKADELDGVKVTLAKPEAFERASIDRLFILTKLRYEPDLNAEGRPVIHVTSRQAIREPFLNFLIEVNWAKGRLVREYTVLLDPPVTLDRKPSPVKAPPVTGVSVPKATQPPAPSNTQREVQLSPTQQSEPAGNIVASQAGANGYGPVMANESLWKIANKTKPHGATVEQMMMALQRKNPHAFYRQNVNNLKRGSILRMPTQAEIDLLSVREARAEFSNQVVEWKANRPALATSDAGGKPKATADRNQSIPDSKLELASVRPEGEGKGGVSEGDGTEEITSKLENELLLAREQFESAKQERSDLSSQVSQLESQLTDLENLLAVRNEQLARLQNELRQSEADVASEIEKAPVIAADVELEVAGDGEELTIVDEEVTAISDGEEEIKIADEEPDSSQNDSPAPQKESAPAPQATETAPTESTLDVLKNLFENNMIAVAGGGLVILLLLLLLARRRKAESEEFEESILIGSQGDDTESLGGATDDTESGVSEAAETSFLSEFSHSDMDVLQDDTGEVDPVAEADVYIAYGRYQQAEELLRQAIERDPEQTKSYFKLLEILFVTKNAQAFTEIAETLASKNAGQVDTDAWQQVIAMGHQLNPEHALFIDAAGEGAVDSRLQSAAAMEAEAEADEEDEDLDLMDLSELTADFDMDADEDQEDGPISALLEDDSLDFDLNLGLDADEDKPDSAVGTESDDALLSADIAEISADAGLDDALLDISTELPDSSVSELDAETETSELEESLSLDGLDLSDSFEVGTLDEEGTAQADDSAALLGGADDLAAELSGFIDESAGEEASDSDDLAAELSGSEDELQDEQAKAQELEQALSGFTDDLSLDDALETADSGGELGDLATHEDVSIDLEASLGELSGLDESLSLDALMEDDSEKPESPDETLESDELVLGDPELGELSLSEGDDLSDEDLIIEDEPASSLLMDESLSELMEEPDEIDKINTKLDLARAYVEMGDEEGARNILDEVLNEGDDMQKQDAQELLGRLS